MKIKRNKGFSLMEIMLVIFIISLVVAFGLPQYSRAIDKSNEKNARLQLMALHAANFSYLSAANEFLDDGGSPLDVSEINNGLEMNIIPNGATYSYTRPTINEFIATAIIPGASGDFELEVTQGAIKAMSPNANPCCSAGTCPSVPNC